MPQPIWCDENGFTGNRLLDKAQPFFTYASVAVGDLEAREIASRIIKDASVQGELKASKLLRYNAGRKAVEQLFRDLEGRFLVSASHKKFALACKFFEYIFEPALSANNSFFYRIRFHKFIANLLYVHFIAKRASAEDIFEEFESAMRDLDEARLNRLLVGDGRENERISLQPVLDFGILNFEAVREELSHLRGHSVGKWVLDLSASALYSHMGFWGDRFDTLEVYCDSSKPIYEAFPLDSFVGRSEKVYTDISGERHLLTPSLAKPIALLNSRDHAALQIADIVAGTCGRAMSDRTSDLDRIRPLLIGGLSGDSVLPEPDEYLSGPSMSLHAPILGELVRRSRAGESLLENLADL